MAFAPIVIFVFNRLEHTKKTIESLKKNPESSSSDLVCYSDGARPGRGDDDKVIELRAWLKNSLQKDNAFKSVTIVERTENWGLARSIIDGVTTVVRKNGQVIVLEDDMLLSPYFLKYMNEGLQHYANDERVCSLHGYCFPVKEKLPESFFLRGADCWGWATWQRGWDVFEADGTKLYQALSDKNLHSEFNFNNSYDYSGMLKMQIEGKNNSWAIRWYASAFLANKLTLYPGRSLVHNFGMDSSGTHCDTSDTYSVALTQTPVNVVAPVVASAKAFQSYERFFRGAKETDSVFVRTLKRLKFYIKKIL